MHTKLLCFKLLKNRIGRICCQGFVGSLKNRLVILFKFSAIEIFFIRYFCGLVLQLCLNLKGNLWQNQQKKLLKTIQSKQNYQLIPISQKFYYWLGLQQKELIGTSFPLPQNLSILISPERKHTKIQIKHNQ